jgi:hypothetical protein
MWRTRAVFVIVVAIDFTPPSLTLSSVARSRVTEVNAEALLLVLPSPLSCAGIASIHAGPEEPAAINPAAFKSVCQWQICGFHRYFAGFPGFSLENPDFPHFLGFLSAVPAPGGAAPVARFPCVSALDALFGKKVYPARRRR